MRYLRRLHPTLSPTELWKNPVSAHTDTREQHHRLRLFLSGCFQRTVAGPLLTPAAVGWNRNEFQHHLKLALTERAIYTVADSYERVGEAHYSIPSAYAGPFANALRSTDLLGTSYRQQAVRLLRSDQHGETWHKSVGDIFRGYMCSQLCPNGGVHLVNANVAHGMTPTSPTLGATFPPALGSALGIHLAKRFSIPTSLPANTISVICTGDGSIDHPNILSTLNAAHDFSRNHFHVPLMMVVSDNKVAISRRSTYPLSEKLARWGFPVFSANAKNPLEVYREAKQCERFVRDKRRPAFLTIESPRMFGHSANRRNEQYSDAELRDIYDHDPLFYLIAQGIQSGDWTLIKCANLYESIFKQTALIAEQVANESKVSNVSLLQFKAAKNADIALPALSFADSTMRRAISAELRKAHDNERNVVMFGQDLVPGHYGAGIRLQKFFNKQRVYGYIDDELSMAGAAIGLTRTGILPIVEFSYRAYFIEGGLQQLYSWLIQQFLIPTHQPQNGIIFRMPFGGMVKGGPTHNENSMPERLYPNVLVYVTSTPLSAHLVYQLAIAQAKQGRIVVINEPTYCYNLVKADYPGQCDVLFSHTTSEYQQGDLLVYQYEQDTLRLSTSQDWSRGSLSEKHLIICYGNGLKQALTEAYQSEDCIVVEFPCLEVTAELMRMIAEAKSTDVIDECRPIGSPGQDIATALATSDHRKPFRLFNSPNSFIPSGPAGHETYLNYRR